MLCFYQYSSCVDLCNIQSVGLIPVGYGDVGLRLVLGIKKLTR